MAGFRATWLVGEPLAREIQLEAERATRAPRRARTVDTATWQLAILPSAPVYCRFTPTECFACFGELVSSSARIAACAPEPAPAGASTRALPPTASR